MNSNYTRAQEDAGWKGGIYSGSFEQLNTKLEKTLTNQEFDRAAVAKLPDNAFFFTKQSFEDTALLNQAVASRMS